MNDKPEELHAREYAMHILDDLGWPNDRGNSPNLLLITECLIGISKSKRLTHSQAHSYMVRAIKLAKDQGVKVDRFFFRDGVYMDMRPAKTLPAFKPMSAAEKRAVAEHQSTPEFEAMRAKMDELLKKLCGEKKL